MNRILHIALIASTLLAAVGLFLAAGFRFSEPIWLQRPELVVIAASFSYAFLLVVAIYGVGSLLRTDPKRLRVLTVLLAGVLVTTIISLSFAADTRMSRLVLGYETVLLFTLLLVNTLPKIHPIAKICVNVALLAITIPSSLTDISRNNFKELVLDRRSVDFDDSTEFVITGLHDIKVTTFPLFDTPTEQNGGAIVRLSDDRYLIGTARGNFFDVSVGGGRAKAVRTTIDTPLNLEAYADTEGFPSGFFRVTDIFLVPSDRAEKRLLASHHFWNADNHCVTLALSETTIDITDLETPPPDWKMRFQTSPCLDVEVISNRNGGRIALLSQDSILMTVGSHAYELTVPDLSYLDESSYGKIFRFDLDDWSYEVFSTGHRNPQGLLVTADAIWSTEHGPQGGDELNLIVQGEDYGWPRSTYGTDYGLKIWPMLVGPEDHSVGRQPVYAWMPSIGASELIQISGPAFPEWRGDLLVSSLQGAAGLDMGRSLYRVRMQDGRAILVERIRTGRRIRDLVERDDGAIVLWDGDYALQIVEPASHVFAACNGCHVIGDGFWHGIGPDLLGIVDARVARKGGFDYSEAMEAFGGRWTTERLDAYLRDPSAAVPGTTMLFPGIEDDELRAEIIEYLVEANRR